MSDPNIERAERLAGLFEDSARDEFQYVSDKNDFMLAAQALRAVIAAAKEENWDSEHNPNEKLVLFGQNVNNGFEFFQRALQINKD